MSVRRPPALGGADQATARAEAGPRARQHDGSADRTSGHPDPAVHDTPGAVRLADGSEAVRLPDGASTADLLAALGVDARRCVTVVNGVAHPRPVPLREGDRIQLHVNQAGG